MARTRHFGTVRRLPSGRWQARYYVDGRRHTAPRTFDTKTAAAGWLAHTQTDLDRGVWKPPAEAEIEARRTAAAAVTVAEAAEAWLATIPSHNHKTMSASRVRRFINPALGDVPVSELTRARCEAWYADLCPKHPTQRRRTYAALNAILNGAVDREIIDVNPLRIKGALADSPAREPQTATAAEVDELAAAMPERLALAVQLAAWCGLRAGEVLGLQRGDVVTDPVPVGKRDDPVVRLLLRRHIVHGRGTGGIKIVAGTKAAVSTESVVVPPHLVAALNVHLVVHCGAAGTAWLFPGARTPALPTAPTTLHRYWDRARKSTGLQHLTFHDLRRTGNTLAAQAGATAAELRDRMRHKSSRAAERYIVAARGADAALARRMSEAARDET